MENKLSKSRVLEVKKIPKKDIIIPEYIMRPLEDKESEDIKSLSDSIESNGMINEIDVRLKDGKYELMAGARRFVATNDEEVLVKVFVDVSDLKAMIIGLTENAARKNPDILSRDRYIYSIWKKGKKEGTFVYIKDLASQIGMTDSSLRVIISAGEDKEKDSSIVIQNASSWDLEKTRMLSQYPDIRKDLLKKEQEKKLTANSLAKISNNIKIEMDRGINKEVVMKALELTDNTKKIYLKNDLMTKSPDIGVQVIKSPDTVGPTSKAISITAISEPEVTVKISDKTFKEILATYNESPIDVKQYLEKGEISIEDAKELKKFDSPERRNQIKNEIQKIEQDKKISQEVHDWDKKINIDTRLKQQEDLNKKGSTETKTRFDREEEERLNREANKDEIHDKVFLERYQNLSSYTLQTFDSFPPKRIKTEETKKSITSIIKNLYLLYREVLEDMGELKSADASTGNTGETDNTGIKRLIGEYK